MAEKFPSIEKLSLNNKTFESWFADVGGVRFGSRRSCPQHSAVASLEEGWHVGCRRIRSEGTSRPLWSERAVGRLWFPRALAHRLLHLDPRARAGLALLLHDRLQRHVGAELGRRRQLPPHCYRRSAFLDGDERHLHLRPVVGSAKAAFRTGSSGCAEQWTARPFAVSRHLLSAVTRRRQRRNCGALAASLRRRRPAQSGAERGKLQPK